ncbi:baseplate J/gp47 family protein [Ferrovibrio terrae]|uniref:baseplate J/gp47 family protein n=1 Tax=Ferrovibrio terrae TaxID=2594003 RepID=UPI003137EA35
MAFQRPSLTDLVARVQSDIDVRLPGADSRLRRSALTVLAYVIAGTAHMLYGFIEWVARQILPDTSDLDILARHASIWSVLARAATFATGNVTLAGISDTVIAAGTRLLRNDGLIYRTTAEVTIEDGAATAPVEAESAGLLGNAAAGVVLNLITPIAGVQSAAAVAVGGLTGGADDESAQSLLARLLQRIQLPPHGGADFDYPYWAKKVAGVTRVWVAPRAMGLGTVTVRFMMDDAYDDGIPQPADVTAVQAYIDQLSIRPVTCEVFVVAPIAVPLNFQISGLNPSTTAVREAIKASLKDLIRREAVPGGTILYSHIREAISVAAGEYNHGLVAPVADVAHGTGHICTLGVVSFV